MKTSHYTICLSLLAVVISSGCQAVTSVAHKPFDKIPTASKQDPVVEMICLWEPAEGLGLDNLPSRGFAGQILFFTSKGSEPVKIEGDVHVYIFDDLGTSEEQAKPIHRFDFDKDSFQAFLTQTNLGYAYQLFLPYTRKSGHKTTCSIRVRVNQDGGRPVYSKMASVILSGTEAPVIVEKAKPATSGIQQVGFETRESTPSAESSALQAAAYFGGASLPVQKVDTTNSDRQRLRSTLSQVVQDASTSPGHQQRHQLGQPTSPASSAEAAQPAIKRHPLADF